MSDVPEFLLSNPIAPASAELAAPAWLDADVGIPQFLRDKYASQWLDSDEPLDMAENAGLTAPRVDSPAQPGMTNEALATFIAKQGLRAVMKEFKRMLTLSPEIRVGGTMRESVSFDEFAAIVESDNKEAASCFGYSGAQVVAHYCRESDSFEIVSHTREPIENARLSAKSIKAIAWKLASCMPEDTLTDERKAAIMSRLLQSPRLATRKS